MIQKEINTEGIDSAEEVNDIEGVNGTEGVDDTLGSRWYRWSR